MFLFGIKQLCFLSVFWAFSAGFSQFFDNSACVKMNQAPVSCVPVPKMSKARKIVEEAKETKNPELDLVDKGLTAFDELPGLCEFLVFLEINQSFIFMFSKYG